MVAPDQNQGPVFHKGEQIILLAFVKTVNLIHKSMVFLPYIPRLSFAWAATASISFLPATVALSWVKQARVVLAITLAMVVFPVPGGP